ncbi:MAG: glutamine synthetase III, partial [Clostridia bacterium]|nr:glutamine synthetase III [Clostridia bacterium]
MNTKNIPEIFGSMVFNDKAMKRYLPEDTYLALKKTIENGKSLDKTIAG